MVYTELRVRSCNFGIERLVLYKGWLARGSRAEGHKTNTPGANKRHTSTTITSGTDHRYRTIPESTMSFQLDSRFGIYLEL